MRTSSHRGALLLEPGRALGYDPRDDAERFAGELDGHGAGAGMRHPFMEGLSERLVARGIATLRYQFPYVERGDRRPDPPGILVATVRAAVARAAEEGLPLFAGGKSLGGRMTSTAASSGAALAGVRGIVFFGFPLHAPGRPGAERADHLARVAVPMLFLQGTRDEFARILDRNPGLSSIVRWGEQIAAAVPVHVEGPDPGDPSAAAQVRAPFPGFCAFLRVGMTRKGCATCPGG